MPALKLRSVPHEYHVSQGESWPKTETSEQFYRTVGKFLRPYVKFA